MQRKKYGQQAAVYKSSLPVGCPPWPSVSLRPRQCDVAGAKRWLASPGWPRRPLWSNAAVRRTPARDRRSSRWKRPSSLSPWRWPTAGRGRSTGCQPEPPPAWGCPPLRKDGQRKVRETNPNGKLKLLADVVTFNVPMHLFYFIDR